MSALAHLVVMPIVLPLVVGAAMLLLAERHRRTRAALGFLSLGGLLATAITLLVMADGAGAAAGIYRLGDWPAPFAIVLVADRLAAAMLVLAAVLGIAAAVFSLAGWHRAGVHFHPLFQFLLMGLNGSFLTGDLFNLFVFFEVMLAASYGLVLHGGGIARARAGLHYIAVNIAASMLFLVGVGLIYSVTGTLNMADLAVRIPQVMAGDRLLLEAGMAILGVAFLVKAGMWPLSFWLPTAYAAAAAPVAAVMAVMSKVGVYVILRLSLLLSGDDGMAGFGGAWLLGGGLLTIAFGAFGVLAAQDMARMASYAVLVSSGTVLAAIGIGGGATVSSALFYLVSSTLAISALFLLIELVERGRAAGADILAVTREAYREVGDDADQAADAGPAMPGTMAVLGAAFTGCALILAGLPPLSGFVAKFALLDAALAAGGTMALTFLVMLIVSGLMTLIALTRAGIRLFWATPQREIPDVRVVEAVPVLALLVLCAVLTVKAGPVMDFVEAAVAALQSPYIQAVLP